MHLIGDSFTPYEPGHWAMLALTVVGIAVLILLGRRLPDRTSDRASRIFAVALLGMATVNLAVGLWPPHFALGQSLPLHFSDVLRFVAGYALWSRRRWAVAITYFWGLTMNPQAILTPNLDYILTPWYDFTAYWAQHIAVMWAPIWLTWVLRIRPTWRDYRQSMTITVSWAASVFVFNLIAGTNYGFLNGKPASGSALDLLGGWPIYLLVELLAMIIIWALITWPWSRPARIRRPGRPRSQH